MALLPPPPRKHKGILLACVLLLGLLVTAAIYGKHGLMHLLRMQNEQRALEQHAFALQQGNERLRVRRLQSDDSYIEKLAREHLGLAKKGEILYRVTPPTPVK